MAEQQLFRKRTARSVDVFREFGIEHVVPMTPVIAVDQASGPSFVGGIIAQQFGDHIRVIGEMTDRGDGYVEFTESVYPSPVTERADG